MQDLLPTDFPGVNRSSSTSPLRATAAAAQTALASASASSAFSPLTQGLQVAVFVTCNQGAHRKPPHSVNASQSPYMHSQGWDAFGDSPYHPPVDTPSPVAVDGVDRHQVDMLFQQADWNQDGRQAFHLLPCSTTHSACHQCYQCSS